VIKFLNHFSYEVASKHAMNSASIVDDAIIVCLVLFHDIAPPAKIKTYPEVNFLESLQPKKSEYEYPTTSR
jgi:hypothetical protein